MAGMDLGRGADECDRGQTGNEPRRIQSLAGGNESHSQTDQNRRAEIEQPAGSKVEDRESVHRDEWCLNPWQEDLPTRPQNETGNKVGSGKKRKRR